MTRFVELNLYCDEVKPAVITDPVFGDQEWAYIGMLIVPVTQEEALLRRLLDLRCCLPDPKQWGRCERQCERHESRDREVHYRELSGVVEVAKRWLDFHMLEDVLSYSYILGIDLSTLDAGRFGQGKDFDIFMRIYNRFFRTAVLKSVKGFFHHYDRIIIRSLVHDGGDQEHSNFFPWHLIWKVEQEDPKVSFVGSRIEFLSSDHKRSGDVRSNLLQYIDIVLGATFSALHYSAPKDPKKTGIGCRIAPFVRRQMHEPGNKNTRYTHYHRHSIEFFPRKGFATENEFELAVQRLNSFYKRRDLLIERRRQPMLPFGEAAATLDVPENRRSR